MKKPIPQSKSVAAIFFKTALVIFLFNNGYSQVTVQSSCSGSDSIKAKYRKDADRLALRKTFSTPPSTYKDSIRINRSLSNSYLGALMAVYNATALPVRDSIINMFGIHTDLSPEMNSITIKAPGNLSWMQSLFNSTIPTGNAQVDYYINKFYFFPIAYYTSVNYDVAVLRTDSNFNMVALSTGVKTITGVMDASPNTAFNDVRNIVENSSSGYVNLDYSYGWGETCENGCDYRRTWHFKIDTSCKVTYVGSTGDILFVGLRNYPGNIHSVRVYPVPAGDKVHIDFAQTENKSVGLEIYDAQGKKIYSDTSALMSQSLNIKDLEAGIYFLKLQADNDYKVLKFVKE